MNSLKQIMKDRAKKTGIPIGAPPSETLTKDDIRWEKAKRELDAFPANIPMMIKELIEKDPKCCDVTSFGTCGECKKTMSRGCFTLSTTYPEYKKELIVYECDQHSIRSVQYVVYNNQRNTCYARRVIKLGNSV